MKFIARAQSSLQASNQSQNRPVIVVGAGVAGLNCAAKLHKAGVPVVVIEGSDGIGGRVRTDSVDGFLLDRGFQIFLTSYPEARDALDYAALDLRPFYAGALVHWQGSFHRVADPLRHFVDGISSLLNPIGTPVDKINVGIYRLKCLLGTVEDLLIAPETTILECLRNEGFSESIIDRFFRPFLGGIFFDRQLGTTSRLFNFVMRMLATGENCLPAKGIGAVADQLAAVLPSESILLNSRVVSISPASKKSGSEENSLPCVTLGDGTTLSAHSVVVATEGPEAVKLLGSSLDQFPSKKADPMGTCCLYFSAERPPLPGNVLYLDGEGLPGSIVNNCCFPSEVSPTYAPPNKTLVSVSTLSTLPQMSDEDVEKKVRQELSQWFDSAQVSRWKHLKTYRIPYAQPNQAPPTDTFREENLGNGIYVIGDHRTTSTVDGALKSGRIAAEMILSGR